MGLFSSFKSNAPALTVPIALMIPSVALMSVDGDIDDDEVSQLRSICILSPIYARNSRDEDTEIMIKALNLVSDKGAETACKDAAQLLSEGLKRTAFIFATLVAFADGRLGNKEQSLLEQMVGWFGLPVAEAEGLVTAATVLKHRADA